METGIRRIGSDSTLLILVNAHSDVVTFKLPKAMGGRRWLRLIDTNAPQKHELTGFRFGHAYPVPAQSLLLFVLQPTRTAQRTTAAERSFQRVVQAVEESALKSVRFGFD